MPLPPIIQTTDTFNTWFDATNNLISSLSNTSTYVIVDGSPSTGNIAVNGAILTAMLIANANVSLGGTSLTSGVLRIATNTTTSTLSLSGSNLVIGMTNTVISGTDLTINPNTVLQGATTVNGIASLTKNVALVTSIIGGISTVGVFSANSSLSSVNLLGNTITTTINSASGTTITFTSNVATYTSNSWTVNVLSGAASINASNVYVTSVNNVIVSMLTLSTNVGGVQTFTLNATTAAVNTNAHFNFGVTLGGPLTTNTSYVQTADSFLSGNSTAAAPLSISSNATIYRVGVVDESPIKIIPAITTTTGAYRQITIFNIGNVPFSFGHANSAYGANGIFCPANTNFHVPGHSTCVLYYDVGISRWRVVGSAGDANSTMTGTVNTGAQSFSGAKTFLGATTFSGAATFSGTSTFSQQSYLSNIIENASVSASGASATTINLDTLTAPILYYQGNSSGNWTLNLRGNATTSLSSLLAVGQSLTCSFLSTQGASGFYASTVQVDGTTQSVKWQNGVAPASAASTNSVDAYTLVVVKTAATPTYTVFGAVTKFA